MTKIEKPVCPTEEKKANHTHTHTHTKIIMQ